jgi:hypothetical protein
MSLSMILARGPQAGGAAVAGILLVLDLGFGQFTMCRCTAKCVPIIAGTLAATAAAMITRRHNPNAGTTSGVGAGGRQRSTLIRQLGEEGGGIASEALARPGLMFVGQNYRLRRRSKESGQKAA